MNGRLSQQSSSSWLLLLTRMMPLRCPQGFIRDMPNCFHLGKSIRTQMPYAMPYRATYGMHCKRLYGSAVKVSQPELIQTATTQQSNSFQASKASVLELLKSRNRDRSMKGTTDKQIEPLLDEINSKANLYTTSSCAGRVQILGIMKKKGRRREDEVMCRSNSTHQEEQPDNKRSSFVVAEDRREEEEQPDNNKSSFVVVAEDRPYWMYQNHSGIDGEVLRDLHQRMSGRMLAESERILAQSDNEGYGRAMGENKEEKKLEESFGRMNEGLKQDQSIIEEGVLNIPENGNSRLIEIRCICQGPILHIATPTVETGNNLMMKLQHAGIKQTTIRSITQSRTVLSCKSSTNIIAILWLRVSATTGLWLVNLSDAEISDALADAMTSKMRHSRQQYFTRVSSVINDEIFNS